MNITESKFHALVMYAGRIPSTDSQLDGAVKIIRRCIAVLNVAGLPQMPSKGRQLDDYMNNLLHGIDLLYGYPTDRLRYLIAMEFIDKMRKRQKEERCVT